MKKNFTLLLFGSTLAFPASAQETCLQIYYKLKQQRERLAELSTLQTELSEKFKSFVEKDFDDQSQGLLEEVHRNEAIKVAFAQKKLTRSLEVQTRTVASLSIDYCSNCLEKAATTKDAIKDFCTRCPDSSKCSPKKEK